MKVKIELDKNETREEAEEKLEKALATKRKARQQYYKTERYADQSLEDLHEHITKLHEQVVSDVLKEIQDLVKSNIKG